MKSKMMFFKTTLIFCMGMLFSDLNATPSNIFSHVNSNQQDISVEQDTLLGFLDEARVHGRCPHHPHSRTSAEIIFANTQVVTQVIDFLTHSTCYAANQIREIHAPLYRSAGGITWKLVRISYRLVRALENLTENYTEEGREVVIKLFDIFFKTLVSNVDEVTQKRVIKHGRSYAMNVVMLAWAASNGTVNGRAEVQNDSDNVESFLKSSFEDISCIAGECLKITQKGLGDL